MLLVLALHYLLVQAFLLLGPLPLLVSVLALFFTGLVSNGALKRAAKKQMLPQKPTLKCIMSKMFLSSVSMPSNKSLSLSGTLSLTL